MTILKLSLALTIANIPVLLAFVFGNWYFLGLIPSTIIAVWVIHHETYKLLWTDYGVEPNDTLKISHVGNGVSRVDKNNNCICIIETDRLIKEGITITL